MDVLGVERWLTPHMSARRYGGVTAGVPANFSVRYQSQTKEHWARNLLRWTLIDDERRFGCRDKVEIQLCIYCVRVVITFHLWQNRFYKQIICCLKWERIPLKSEADSLRESSSIPDSLRESSSIPDSNLTKNISVPTLEFHEST